MKIRISTKCLVFAYLLIPCGLITFAHAIPPFVAPVPIYLYDTQGGLGNGSVAIAGNTLAVAGSNANGGLVYVYQLINNVWIESARLSTSDTQVGVNGSTDFGSSVAVSPDGSTIFVGDPTAACASNATLPCGAVDIYQEPAGGWASSNAPAARLVPSMAASQELGYRIALSSDGSTLAALGDAVYVFMQPSSGWANSTQAAILGTPGGQGVIGSGAFVGLSVDTAVVATNTSGQSVLVYAEPNIGWQDMTNPTAVLTSSASGFDDELGDFGSQLKVSGNIILIGAPAIPTALVYQKPATGWASTSTATAVLQPPSSSVGFARGIDMVGNTAVVSDGNQLVYYDEPAGGWSSESESGGTVLPSDSSMYSWPLSLGAGSVYVTGSELVTSSNLQYDEGILPMFIAGYVLSNTAVGSNYSGMMIDRVTVDDPTTSGVRVTSGFTGDELRFNFDVQNVKAPDAGTATFQATGSGGTITAASVSAGGSCQLSDDAVTCNLSLAAGQNTTVQITEQTSATASQASVTTTLSNVSPQSWDPLAATLTAALPLTPAPVVPAQVTFTAAPGSIVNNTLPVIYIGKNSLTFIIVYQPLDGSLTVNSATGVFTWTPPGSSYEGKTQFTYEVSDGVDTSAASTVTINESGSVTASGGGGGGQFGIWSLLMLTAIAGLLYLRRRNEKNFETSL